MPPTSAPTGPPTLPSTAPAAAPAVGLEIGGMVMFSFDCCCSLDVEFSVDFSAISSPGLMFKLRSCYRHITASSRKGINKKRPTCESGRFLKEYKFCVSGIRDRRGHNRRHRHLHHRRHNHHPRLRLEGELRVDALRSRSERDLPRFCH